MRFQSGFGRTFLTEAKGDQGQSPGISNAAQTDFHKYWMAARRAGGASACQVGQCWGGGSQEPLTGGTALPRALQHCSRTPKLCCPEPGHRVHVHTPKKPKQEPLCLLLLCRGNGAQPCLSAWGKHPLGHVAAPVSQQEFCGCAELVGETDTSPCVCIFLLLLTMRGLCDSSKGTTGVTILCSQQAVKGHKGFSHSLKGFVAVC